MEHKAGGEPVYEQYSGIELSPHTQTSKHYSQPGLEVVDYSDLEVVSPRPDLSNHRTWEKGSSLPQIGTPYSKGVASTYEYGNLNGGGGGYAGGAGRPKNGFFQQDSICGVKRQTFWIVIAIGIFVMVAAVAIGVGLGVALHPSGDPR